MATKPKIEAFVGMATESRMEALVCMAANPKLETLLKDTKPLCKAFVCMAFWA